MDKRSGHPGSIAPASLKGARGSVRVITRRQLLQAAVVLAALYAVDLLAPSAPSDHVQAFINIWVQIAFLVVAAIVSYALAPKPAQPPKPTLSDFEFPTAEEGRAIPVVFGTVWVSGPNVLWYGDLDTTPIKVKGGKK